MAAGVIKRGPNGPRCGLHVRSNSTSLAREVRHCKKNYTKNSKWYLRAWQRFFFFCSSHQSVFLSFYFSFLAVVWLVNPDNHITRYIIGIVFYKCFCSFI